MNIYEALDTIFAFIPEATRREFKNQGLYSPIISGRARCAGDIYLYLNAKQAIWQKTDYGFLAQALKPHLRPGSVLEIGCGDGNLLKQLSRRRFRPLYGLDHSPTMIRLAKKELKACPQSYLITERVEDYNLKKLSGIDNIIINNFWGLLPKRESIRLLLELKKCLHHDGRLIIGPINPKLPPQLKEAADYLEKHLNFKYSYPLFTSFHSLGYQEKKLEIAGQTYYLLSP